MRCRLRAFLTTLALGFTFSGWAQDPTRPGSPAPEVPPQGTKTLLSAGAAVHLRTRSALSSNRVVPGEQIELEVLSDVTVEGLLVIPKYTPLKAVVVSAQPNRRLMRGGSLTLEIKTLNAITGDPIPLRGAKDVKGGPSPQEKADAIMEGRLILSWVPLFLKGGEATLHKGTPIEAVIAADVPLDTGRLRDAIAAFEAQEAGAQAAARNGKATVHIYNDLAGGKHIISLDGRPLAKLRMGDFLSVQPLPGRHAFRAQKSELTLELKPDEEYYIRVISEGFWTKHWELTQVPTDQGQYQLFPLAEVSDSQLFEQAFPLPPIPKKP